LEQQKQIDFLKEENSHLKEENLLLKQQMNEMHNDRHEKDRVVTEALRTMSKQQELLVDLMAQQEILKRKLEACERKCQSSSLSLPTSPEPSSTTSKQRTTKQKRGSMA
jgi:16S rRNA G527 N7-methylase RsmG